MKSKRIEDLPKIPGERLCKAANLGISVADGTYASARFARAIKTTIDIEGFGPARLADNPLSRFVSGFNEEFDDWDECFSAFMRWQFLMKIVKKLPDTVVKEDQGYTMVPNYYMYAAGECPLHKKGFKLNEFLPVADRIKAEMERT